MQLQPLLSMMAHLWPIQMTTLSTYEIKSSTYFKDDIDVDDGRHYIGVTSTVFLYLYLRLKISTRTGNDIINSEAGTYAGTTAMLDGMTADASEAKIGDHVELRLAQKNGNTPFDAFS